MKWRPVVFGLTGLLFLATGIGRWSEGKIDFLAVLPVITGVFYLLAAALWATKPTPRG